MSDTAFDYSTLPPQGMPLTLSSLDHVPQAVHAHYARTWAGDYKLTWIAHEDLKSRSTHLAAIASGDIVYMTEPGLTPATIAEREAEQERGMQAFRDALAAGEQRQAEEQAAQAERARQAQAARDARNREIGRAGGLTADDMRLLRQS